MPPFLLLFLSLSLSFTNATAARFFFSKMTRIEKSTLPQEKKNSTNSLLNSQTSGYGLYGRGGPEQFSPSTAAAAATTDNAERVADEELLNRNFREEYKNRFDNTNINDDPYKFSNKFSEGRYRYRPNYDQRNRQYQYGMSDTRFLENGRYYYDVNGRRFDSNPKTTNPDEYRSYGGGDGRADRYGNEYNKVVNENESQDEYVP